MVLTINPSRAMWIENFEISLKMFNFDLQRCVAHLKRSISLENFNPRGDLGFFNLSVNGQIVL